VAVTSVSKLENRYTCGTAGNTACTMSVYLKKNKVGVKVGVGHNAELNIHNLGMAC
jgi:hypothetical protein